MNMKATDTVLKALWNSFDYLMGPLMNKGLRVEYFMAGSYRFGWFNNDSDLDIMLYCHKYDLNSLYKLFQEFGLEKTPLDTGINYHPQFWASLWGFRGFLHINVMNDEVVFMEVKNQHDRLSSILDDQTIKVLKETQKLQKIKGSVLYKTLVKQVLGETPVGSEDFLPLQVNRSWY